MGEALLRHVDLADAVPARRIETLKAERRREAKGRTEPGAPCLLSFIWISPLCVRNQSANTIIIVMATIGTVLVGRQGQMGPGAAEVICRAVPDLHRLDGRWR